MKIEIICFSFIILFFSCQEDNNEMFELGQEIQTSADIVDSNISWITSYNDLGILEQESIKIGEKTLLMKKYSDGELRVMRYMLNDSVSHELVLNLNNQIVSSRMYLGTVEYGDWIDYYDNGVIKRKGNYGYHEGFDTIQAKSRTDSSLLLVGYTYYLPKDGTWLYWYNNGNLRRFELYDEGKKVGTWKYYLKSGKLNKEEFHTLISDLDSADL